MREWNFSIRGLSDRELLAAAQLACDREVWDRCINTSDRTRAEIDMEQRFPTPLRQDVSARAREIGLDPAFVYGLIRQESRFIMDARSGVGASGLMQLMPATARWTAKKIGLPYSPALITDRDTNLRLGNAYLKLVLDDVGGSQPMAAAAYNAGPGRPRKWREGPVLEPAIWAENIPFAETRDYVKKVLSNAAYYAAGARRQGHDRPLAPRPADRPARPERAADRQRAALSRAPASARIGRSPTRRSPCLSVMPRNFLILGGTGFVGRSVAEKLVERGGGAGGRIRIATPPRGPRQAAAAPADGRGGGRRRPRRGARWRGCCAAPTR